MQPTLFSAGLGDIIRICHLTRSHQYISEATAPVPVLVASHNPFSMELFRFHRNAANFILYDLGHKYVEFLHRGLRGPEISKALCDFAGVDYAALVRGPAPEYRPEFDAPDNLEVSGHIVFQPFAGNAGYRSLPEGLIEKMMEALRQLPFKVFVVTRSYLREPSKKGAVHHIEDARRWEGGNIQVLEHLSVPATLNLVRRCRAFLGGLSSMCQAAWFDHRPVALFYPPGNPEICGTPRSGYAFGIERKNCLPRDYGSADMEELKAFLRRLPETGQPV